MTDLLKPKISTIAVVPELHIMSLDSYSENEEQFYGDYNETKTSVRHQEWTSYHSRWSTSKPGIKPQIRKPTEPVHSFKKAIMLMVVVERLKGSKEFDQWSNFEDKDLLLEDCNHLLDEILVEEKICCVNIQSTCATHQFKHSKKTVHVIKDKRHRCLTLKQVSGRAFLVALSLVGPNEKNAAKIEMDSYISLDTVEGKCPVTLGIGGSNLFLCCAPGENEQTPMLSLTEVANIQEKTNDDLSRYLFYKTQNFNGDSIEETTFESVAFPRWYISTSQQEQDNVQIKPENDQTSIRDFGIYSVEK